MILFPPIPEFTVHGPWDRGISNRERVVFIPNVPLNLASYGVLVGYGNANLAEPLPDNFFWFNELEVNAGTWVFLYTGPGTTRYTTVEGSGAPAVVLHWGKPNTIFNTPEIVPILFKFGAIRLIAPLTQLPPPPTQQSSP
mgnify:CR=1 FL=1